MREELWRLRLVGEEANKERSIEPELLDRALVLSGARTREEAVTVAPCAKAEERLTIDEMEAGLRYSRAQVSGESVSRWTSGQSTRQQPQTRLPSERIRSASLVQAQPGF